MKTPNTRSLALAGFAFVAVTFVAWKSAEPGNSVHHYSPGYEQREDTLPVRKRSYPRKEIKLHELDGAMQDLDRAMVELDKNLKVDLGKMNRELKSAMAELKNIDFDKIHAEVKASLKEIDEDGIRSEIKRALRDVEKELKELDEEHFHVELDAAKTATRISRDIIKSSVDVGLKAAKLGIQTAKKELEALKEFTNELEKDGLINKKDGYKIQIKDNELLINDKKQSKEINDKYRKYLKSGNLTISADDKDWN